MTDRRDEILARLAVILGGLTPNFYHNRGELPDDKRPAITLLDADEIADVKEFQRGRLAKSPNLIRLTAEIYITLDGRKPQNVNVGSDLNATRIAILKAVLFDLALQGIVGANGEIRYDGCMTDLARNRAMDGEMGITISFVYPFMPTEL